MIAMMDDSTSSHVCYASRRDVDAAIRSRERRTKRAVIGSLCAVAALIGFYLYAPLGLPRESKVLQNFQTRRPVFEKLRDMMLAEQSIEVIGNGWVTTKRKSGEPIEINLNCGDANFPTDRYQAYRVGLRQAGALAISRNRMDESPTEVNILRGATGFAGESVHIGMTWLEAPPTHQVHSLDEPRLHPSWPNIWRTYCHIDSSWYIGRIHDLAHVTEVLEAAPF